MGTTRCLGLMNQIAIGAAGSIAAALVLLVFGMLLPQIRKILFYRAYRYEFEYDDDFGKVQWDVQWEKKSLTLISDKVHREYLENVTALVNQERPGIELGSMNVGGKFMKIGKWPIYVRAANIVRMKPERGAAEHLIYIEFHLRKW